MSLIFRQLFESESSTYTYILGDALTGEGIIVDPVIETLERDLQITAELGLKIKYVVDTHVHADHVTSSGAIKNRTGAEIVLGKSTGLKTADHLLDDGEELSFGSFKIRTLLTPGHTNGCTSFVVKNMVFTGDTLLIRGCGRTDFQEGSRETLFKSVREKLFSLPDETLVYPGHDYKGRTCSSIGEEKKWNPRLKMSNSFEVFKSIMDGLNLAHPKKIDVAVPANLKHGL
ncbi:MAG: MBL fold metallo-hydrolase [Bdellovibrionales bacterium]|nr:MBL fold metallo-hydrolase [Bdellovibrionales bacterium]NQZ19131.1 MBL fold metallo-hydrolase [Bdellovibrionales bacterium]